MLYQCRYVINHYKAEICFCSKYYDYSLYFFIIIFFITLNKFNTGILNFLNGCYFYRAAVCFIIISNVILFNSRSLILVITYISVILMLYLSNICVTRGFDYVLQFLTLEYCLYGYCLFIDLLLLDCLIAIYVFHVLNSYKISLSILFTNYINGG